MFKMAREMFTPEERADMDVQYEEWKQSPQAMAILAEAASQTGADTVSNKFMQ